MYQDRTIIVVRPHSTTMNSPDKQYLCDRKFHRRMGNDVRRCALVRSLVTPCFRNSMKQSLRPFYMSCIVQLKVHFALSCQTPSRSNRVLFYPARVMASWLASTSSLVVARKLLTLNLESARASNAKMSHGREWDFSNRNSLPLNWSTWNTILQKLLFLFAQDYIFFLFISDETFVIGLFNVEFYLRMKINFRNVFIYIYLANIAIN